MSDLGQDFAAIGKKVVAGMNLSGDDAAKVLKATAGIGSCILRARLAGDQIARDEALKEARDYQDALDFMAGTLAVKAGSAQERALAEVLALVGKVVIGALI